MSDRVPKISRLGALSCDRRGAGAVEFAIIAPLLLIVYMGGVELTVGLTLDRKVKQIASTVGDLVSQDGAVTAGEVDDILAISSTFLQPYSASPFGVVVSFLNIDGAGNAVVGWSRGRGAMKASSPGAVFTLPKDIANLRNTGIVRVETSYRYLPAGGYGFKSPFLLGSVSFTSPRVANKVGCGDCF